MSLNLKQKKYVQDNYPEKSAGEIAKFLQKSKGEVENHIDLKKNIFDKKFPQQSVEHKIDKYSSLITFGILAVLVLIAYANAFGASFVSDDIASIVLNENNISTLSYIKSLPYFAPRLIEYYISYKLGGLTPFYFRIWGIMAHIGFVFLIYLIGKEFYPKKYISFIAASLAAVHPIMIESVSWISGGIYAHSGLFVLASFYTYMVYKVKKYPKFRLLMISLFLFLLALSFGQKVIVYPFAILLFELLFGSVKSNWKILLGYFGISFFFSTSVLFKLFTPTINSSVSVVNTVVHEYHNPLIQIPVAVGTYLKLFLWPINLSLYQSEMSLSYVGFGILCMFTILFFLIIYKSYQNDKIVFFWLIFFLIFLSVNLNPFGIGWMVAERYVYLSTAGLYIVLAVLIQKVLDNKKYEVYGYIILAIILILLSVRTIIRNNDWKNEDNLWIATGKTSPSDPKTHNNLGDVYGRHGDLKRSAEEFKIAIKLNPNYADAYHNLGNTYQQMGKVDLAIQNYKKASELNPALWQSFQNMSILYYEKGDFKEALENMIKAKAVNPTNINIDVNIAVLYMRLNEFQKASELVNQILKVDPQNKIALKLSKELKSVKN